MFYYKRLLTGLIAGPFPFQQLNRLYMLAYTIEESEQKGFVKKFVKRDVFILNSL